MGGYTPGPWIHVQSDNIILTHDGRRLLQWQARSLDVSTDERDANARLIASAPDLLKALQKVEAHLSAIGTPRDAHGRYHKDGEWTFDEALPRDVDAREVKSAFEVVRAAISRATGEGE